ncbi:EF-hand domain-containing protein [Brevundimonas staleyi]|uniref:EF-hand domain-containing protein n=1 Tax=Brevundimonas staleyi TaxID=74326 RepID=A0ABW0FY77_9CAUL
MRKTILAAGVAALAVLTAGSALAQQAPQPGQQRVARADADRDGRVSRAEFVDARVARLTALDTNRDGQISVEERRAAGQARRAERVANRFARLDKDGNGAISREEFTAPREARADRPREGRRAGMQGQRGPRAHWAGNRGHRGGWGGHRGPRAEGGVVTIADVQTRLTTQFDRVDANRDGFITAEERTAARQAAREQRGERRAERMAHRAARQPSPSAPASE